MLLYERCILCSNHTITVDICNIRNESTGLSRNLNSYQLLNISISAPYFVRASP